MESITRFITVKLKLKVNEEKSAVARPQQRKFLGLSFTAGPEVKRVIAPKALDWLSDESGRSCAGPKGSASRRR
jgi:RNA-directed DNA polymerase